MTINVVYLQFFQVGKVFEYVCRQFSDVVHADVTVETQGIRMRDFLDFNQLIISFVLTGGFMIKVVFSNHYQRCKTGTEALHVSFSHSCSNLELQFNENMVHF